MSTDPSASVFGPEVRTLPVGFSGLPRELVISSQRQRLIHGVVVAVGSAGFAGTTVADIVRCAGVSKKTFYEHFEHKLACFLAAYELGCEAMLDAVRSPALEAINGGASPVEQLARATDGFVRFLEAEEPFARMFYLEIPAAGSQAVAAHRRYREMFIEQLRAWHDMARASQHDWPPVADLSLEAAAAAVNDIALSRVVAGRADELALLTEALVRILLDLMRVPVAIDSGSKSG